MYKVKFVDKKYGINLMKMKQKHYNIIPRHLLFQTKATNFNHFFQMKKKNLHS
jgi:hypothetical protein